MILTELIY